MKRSFVSAVASLIAAVAFLPSPAVAQQASAVNVVERSLPGQTAVQRRAGHHHPQWRSPRGRLLSAKPLRTAAALPSARANYLVKYTSRGARGELILVSGTVALPRGKAPRKGWPVISWAHGTTGTADVCAPSRDRVDGPAHDYLSAMDATLDRWVAKGFAVVKTDYEGLGTPGEHPYIHGDSAANTVVDIVRAARQLNHRVGRDWFAVGHSQGGQAALFAAAKRPHRYGLHLRGAIPLAPGGTSISQLVPFIQSGQPGSQAAIAFLPTILIGAAAADPAVNPRRLLTDGAEQLLDVANTACQRQIAAAAAAFGSRPAFAPGADVGPLTAYLRTQEPQNLTIKVPTLVLQGTADVLVRKPSTDFLVSELRKRSDRVQYRIYEGADHRGVVSASFADQLQFAKLHLRSRR